MQQRLLGSVFVVIIGLIPTLVGGPMFAVLMAILTLLAYREYGAIARSLHGPQGNAAQLIGMAAILLFAFAPLLPQRQDLFFAACILAVLVSLAAKLPAAADSNAVAHWSTMASGALYIGLPAVAAVSLRLLPEPTQSPAWNSFTSMFSLTGPEAPRGLAWALVVVLATWVGDSTAYLSGRAFGRRKLAPRVSPGKTVEGAIGGLLGSLLMGSLVFVVSGLGAWWWGAVVGAIVGVVGQVGDLSESLLKRQAGVKDSGTLIPGHGGMLDRIDALLFAFPAAYLLAISLGWLGLA